MRLVGHAEHHELPGGMSPYVLMAITMIVVAIGVAIAWRLVQQRPVPRVAPENVSWATKAARADLYGDAINDTVVVGPTMGLTRALKAIDDHVIDGAVEDGASWAARLGDLLRKTQNDFVPS